MENKISILSLVIAILYLISKGFLMLKNEYGFLIAVIAAGLTTYKFWKIDNTKILAILEIGTIFYFLYSFHKWQSAIFEVTALEKIIFGICIGLAIIFTIIQYIKIPSITTNLILETISMAGFTLGGLLLIYQNKYGWLGYILGHTGIMIIQYRKKDIVFAIFQVISILIALYAFFYFI